MNGIVYMDLKPDYAKLYNLPIKLPVLITDFKSLDLKKPLPLDLIVRGLKFEYEHTKSDYYKSYLIYFLYEQFKYFLNKGELELAQMALKEANKLNDDHRKEFFNGIFFETQGELKKAEVEFRKSIFKDGSFPYSKFELAKILYKNEEFEEAINELKKIITIDKTFSLAYNLLSDIYIYQKNYNEALKVIIQGLSIDENFQPFYEKLTAVYNDAGYFENTIKFYENAKSKINSPRALYNIAFAYMNEGLLSKSIKILEPLRNENEDYIYELLARSYRLKGKYQDAIEVLKKGYDITSSPVLGISYANTLRAVLDLYKAEDIYREVSKSGKFESLFFAYYMYENYFHKRGHNILVEISELLNNLDREKNKEYFNEFEYIISKNSLSLSLYIQKLNDFLSYYFYSIPSENFVLEFKPDNLAYNLWIPIFFRDDLIFERMVFENATTFEDKIVLLMTGYIIKYMMREQNVDDYVLSYLDLKVSSYYVKANEVLYKIQKNILQDKYEFNNSKSLDVTLSNILYSFIYSDSIQDIRGREYLGEYVDLLKVLISFKTKEASFRDDKEAKSIFIKSFTDMINSLSG